jgi:hypothetical protein
MFVPGGLLSSPYTVYGMSFALSSIYVTSSTIINQNIFSIEEVPGEAFHVSAKRE